MTATKIQRYLNIMASSMERIPENYSKPKKKRSFFPSWRRKKESKHKKDEPSKKIEDPPSQKPSGEDPRPTLNGLDSARTEIVGRSKFDDRDYASSKMVSNRNLIAMAYHSTTSPSFRASPESAIRRFSMPGGKTSSEQSSDSERKSNSQQSGTFSSAIFTRSSFFQKMCDDVFDSIDVDRSGKIDESELYQGLLLIHLKLGLYFGPAACKPISLDRTNFIFGKLDTNRDGSLDKSEFRSVLAILMGNVITRIVFQFICTLLIVPFVASTLLEKILDSYEFVHDTVTESWSSLLLEYRPLIEVAFGLDLIKRFVLSPLSAVIRDSWIGKHSFESLDVPMQVASEKFDSYVLQPIGEIPQETWDSLPLTFISTILSLIIVPYSIIKTDDIFRYLADYFGAKQASKES